MLTSLVSLSLVLFFAPGVHLVNVSFSLLPGLGAQRRGATLLCNQVTAKQEQQLKCGAVADFAYHLLAVSQ